MALLFASTPLFHTGQCLMLVDKERGMEQSDNFIKIEDVTNDSYVYRWWDDQYKMWGVGLNKRPFEFIEKLGVDKDCNEIK